MKDAAVSAFGRGCVKTQCYFEFGGLPTNTQPELIEYSAFWKADVLRAGCVLRFYTASAGSRLGDFSYLDIHLSASYVPVSNRSHSLARTYGRSKFIQERCSNFPARETRRQRHHSLATTDFGRPNTKARDDERHRKEFCDSNSSNQRAEIAPWCRLAARVCTDP